MKRILKVVVFLVVLFLLSLGIELYIVKRRGRMVHELVNPDLYASDVFPEEQFHCRKERQIIHRDYVLKGRERMRKSRVVLCGLCRNIEENMPRITRRMEKTGALFADYRIIVFENDSADGTRALLNEWQEKNPRVLNIETEVKDNKFGLRPLYEFGILSNDRIYRMAHFRNYYLDVVKNEYADFDYMIVLDMDVKGPWIMDGIADTIGHDHWDAVGAYGLMPFPGLLGIMYAMYDPLAYVSLDESYDQPMNQKELVAKFLSVNFIELAGVGRGDELVPVKSCFAGMCVYKIPSIMDARYEGGRCEHIEFHRLMSENGHGKIFMNPSMIILCGWQGPNNLTQIHSNGGKKCTD